MDGFQGDVITALNAQDARNKDLLDQVIDAANAISSNDADVNIEDPQEFFDVNGDGQITEDAEVPAHAPYNIVSVNPDVMTAQDATERPTTMGPTMQINPSVNPEQTRPSSSSETRTVNEVERANEHGYIAWGGKVASLQGTAGVALLEYAKDAIQTAVSNISGMGTQQITARKIVERKVSNLG